MVIYERTYNGTYVKTYNNGVCCLNNCTYCYKCFSVVTGKPGTDAQITNSGTDSNAILDFVIPRGDEGCCSDRDVLAAVLPCLSKI